MTVCVGEYQTVCLDFFNIRKIHGHHTRPYIMSVYFLRKKRMYRTIHGWETRPCIVAMYLDRVIFIQLLSRNSLYIIIISDITRLYFSYKHSQTTSFTNKSFIIPLSTSNFKIKCMESSLFFMFSIHYMRS